MKKISLFLFLLLFSYNIYAQDNSILTIKQQLDKLQRELNEIAKKTFSNSNNNTQKDDSSVNFSTIDIRIYDLEQDINNLTFYLEELRFDIDDLIKKIDKSNEEKINLLISENKLLEDRILKLEKILEILN